jgi:hypothetical protein
MRTGGARFFDGAKRDRGCAQDVRKRDVELSTLTVIDIFGADPSLTAFLVHLDHGHLLMRDPQSGAPLYTFRWASGYENGEGVRIQGVLER